MFAGHSVYTVYMYAHMLVISNSDLMVSLEACRTCCYITMATKIQIR